MLRCQGALRVRGVHASLLAGFASGAARFLLAAKSAEAAHIAAAQAASARSASDLVAHTAQLGSQRGVARSSVLTQARPTDADLFPAQRSSAVTMPLPEPVPGKFSTDVCDCCAEPLGCGHCLYTCACFGCAMGDMAEKIHKGEVDFSKNAIPWFSRCCGIEDPWTRACCHSGFYTIGPDGFSARFFTRLALATVKATYGIEADSCSYCLLSSCGCNLCVQVCVRRARPTGAASRPQHLCAT